jgi:electron transport complex protein RnfG
MAVLDAERFDDPVYVLKDGIVSYQIGMVDGRPVGAVFVLSVRGWNPGIIFLAGVDYNGEISGLDIIQELETPGFGDFIREESFLGQFTGKTTGMVLLTSGTAADNQVVAVAGATISSQAVFRGVNEAVNYFVNNILPAW